MNAPIGSVWTTDFPVPQTTILVLEQYLYRPFGAEPRDWLKVLRLPDYNIDNWPDSWFEPNYQAMAAVVKKMKMTRLR